MTMGGARRSMLILRRRRRVFVAWSWFVSYGHIGLLAHLLDSVHQGSRSLRTTRTTNAGAGGKSRGGSISGRRDFLRATLWRENRHGRWQILRGAAEGPLSTLSVNVPLRIFPTIDRASSRCQASFASTVHGGAYRPCKELFKWLRFTLSPRIRNSLPALGRGRTFGRVVGI